MFSISKAFRVFSLVLAAVLVPATAFAGTTGYSVAKPGAHMIKKGAVKLKTGKSAQGKDGKKVKKAKGAKIVRPKLARKH